MGLVTLQEAKDHLLVDTSAGDSWINMAIEGVSDAVLRWLKKDWRAYVLVEDSNGDYILDSNGDPLYLEDSSGPVVKPVVKMAALVEIAVQYRFRDGDGTPAVPSNWGHGYVLSAGPTSLLSALRKTTVA
jgi:hypothetical protein